MLRGTVPYLQMVWYIPGCIEKLALLLFGRCLVPQILFQRQFLFQDGIEILKIVKGKIPICLLGGVRTWSGMEHAMDVGFSAIQTARTLIRDPYFVKAIEKELKAKGGRNHRARDVVSTCTNCNQCVVATLAEGFTMRCVLRSVLRSESDDVSNETNGKQKGEEGASKLIDIEDL